MIFGPYTFPNFNATKKFRMKIAALDGLRKDAKQKYNDALKSYVTQYFGRPLEKLTLFFDGIQQRLATGIKESEIGYQVPVFFVRHLWLRSLTNVFFYGSRIFVSKANSSLL